MITKEKLEKDGFTELMMLWAQDREWGIGSYEEHLIEEGWDVKPWNWQEDIDKAISIFNIISDESKPQYIAYALCGVPHVDEKVDDLDKMQELAEAASVTEDIIGLCPVGSMCSPNEKDSLPIVLKKYTYDCPDSESYCADYLYALIYVYSGEDTFQRSNLDKLANMQLDPHSEGGYLIANSEELEEYLATLKKKIEAVPPVAPPSEPKEDAEHLPDVPQGEERGQGGKNKPRRKNEVPPEEYIEWAQKMCGEIQKESGTHADMFRIWRMLCKTNYLSLAYDSHKVFQKHIGKIGSAKNYNKTNVGPRTKEKVNKWARKLHGDLNIVVDNTSKSSTAIKKDADQKLLDGVEQVKKMAGL